MAEIAKGYGARLEDTLTGFKWICSKAEDLETKEGLKFICGGEESYGFLCGSFVRDKDAVISSVIACEMLNYYKSIGKTLSSVLDELFMKFGVYQETLLTITLPGKDGLEKMLAMMSLIRNSPPTSIAGSRVVKILDYENSIEKNLVTQSQNPILDLPQSNVLQFILENNSRVSVRPSGTEPKIKFYVSACQLIKGLKGENLEKAKITCQRLAKDIEQEFVSRAKAC